MEDTLARLLEPGAQVIPCAGQVRVALAEWTGLEDRRLGDVAGFDVSPLQPPRDHAAEGPGRRSRADAAQRCLPTCSISTLLRGGPYRNCRTSLELVAEGGRANGVAQWIRLQRRCRGELARIARGPAQPRAGRSCSDPLEHGCEAAAGETVPHASRARITAPASGSGRDREGRSERLSRASSPAASGSAPRYRSRG